MNNIIKKIALIAIILCLMVTPVLARHSIGGVESQRTLNPKTHFFVPTSKAVADYVFNDIVLCSDYANPDDAITDIGATETTLLVTETETCDTNFTVPSTMMVKFERGGKWTIENGITVTFNGQIDAGLWEIFTYTGTGTLAGTPQVKAFYPQWWGALGDGSTDDSDAIEDAVNAVPSGGTIIFPDCASSYIIDVELAINSPMTILGTRGSLIKLKDDSTVIMGVADKAIFKVTSKDVVIDGLNIDGNYAGQSGYNPEVDDLTGTPILIEIPNDNDGNIIIRNCRIDDSTYVSIQPSGTDNTHKLKGAIIENNIITGGVRDAIPILFASQVIVKNNIIINNNHDSIHVYTYATFVNVIGNLIKMDSTETNLRCIMVGHTSYPDTVSDVLVSSNIIFNECDSSEGILIAGGAEDVSVTNNMIKGGLNGIAISNNERISILNNFITECQESGIYLYGTKSAVIMGNTVIGNSQKTTDTYPNIKIHSYAANPCTNNIVKNNTCKKGDEVNIPSCGISLDNAACSANEIVGNDLVDSGTVNLIDNGDGTNIIRFNRGVTTETNSIFYTPTIGGDLTFEGATANDFEILFDVTDPTADRTIVIPDVSGTMRLSTNKLSGFAATSSAELAGVISDETGSGKLVFGTSPDFVVDYAIDLRPANATYTSGFRYDTAGGETLIMATKDTSTKILFAVGHDIAANEGSATTLPSNPELTISDDKVILEASFIQTVVTMDDGDTTPTVAGANVFISQANTNPTEITDLDNPIVGQIVTIIVGNAGNPPTITDGGNFALSAGWTPNLDDVIVLFVQADNDYIEISRSAN